jgi:hypothetical protein
VMQSALSGAWNLVVEAGQHRDRIQDAKDEGTKASDTTGFKSNQHWFHHAGLVPIRIMSHHDA